MEDNFTNSISDIELVELFLKGSKVSEIAQDYNVTREAVYQRLRRDDQWRYIKSHMNKARARERISEVQEHEEEITSGWLAGVSMQDLAKEFNTNRKMISFIIRDKLGSSKRNHERDLEIVKLYDEGMTQKELSKKYGISQPCISRIVNALYEEN